MEQIRQYLYRRVGYDIERSCWEWRGAISSNGYGNFACKGEKDLAHRWSWRAFNGDIPEGLWVLHRCDNRRCVNPEHLFLGDRSGNMKDCARKGRLKLPDVRGEKHSESKLTSHQVYEIRQRYADFKIPQRKLAYEYGVSQGLINHILRGKAWRHLL